MDRVEKLAIVAMVIGFVGYVGAVSLIAYVAWHFISNGGKRRSYGSQRAICNKT